MPRKTTDETIAEWEELARSVDQEIRDSDSAVAYDQLGAHLAEIKRLSEGKRFAPVSKREKGGKTVSPAFDGASNLGRAAFPRAAGRIVPWRPGVAA